MRIDGKRKTITLHIFIIGKQNNDLVIDHQNRKKFDNRRENFRIVDNGMNGFNSNIQINNTSGRTGVHYHKKNDKWTAHIGVNYKYLYLGSFINFEDAVKARQDAEMKYFGEILEI